MSSSTTPKLAFNADNLHHEETVKLIITRLMWIATTTIASWITVGLIAYLTHFPVPADRPDSLNAHQPHMLSIRFVAAILIAHLVSVMTVQIFAPRAVIRGRLASNTMFSALVLSLCASLSVVAHLVPPTGLFYLKTSLEIAFDFTFVIANIFLCGIIGLMIYWARETRLADMVEIYWSLGLMFLLALSTALVLAVVSV
jgi:hypothetical protein